MVDAKVLLGLEANEPEMIAIEDIAHIRSEFEKLIEILLDNNRIDPNLYVEYDVKRGLRDANGKGLLTGLTEVSDVVAFKINDGDKVPSDGELYYHGSMFRI